MILIKKALFYLAFFLTCTLLILLGAANYLTMSGGGVSGVLQVKYQAENAVFISIVAVLVVAVLYLIMGRRNIQVFRELDKISQLSRQGRYYSGDYMRRLGELGERIDTLFLELKRMNEVKSLKIGVLSGMNRFLLEHCELRLCITDVQGTIQHCSKRFADGFDLGMNDFPGKNLVDIVRDLPFEELMREIERKREGLPGGKFRFQQDEKYFDAVLELFPVINVKNELELIVCTAEKEGILSDMAQKAEQVQAKVSKVGKRFTYVLKRKKKKDI